MSDAGVPARDDDLAEVRREICRMMDELEYAGLAQIRREVKELADDVRQRLELAKKHIRERKLPRQQVKWEDSPASSRGALSSREADRLADRPRQHNRVYDWIRDDGGT